MASEYRPHVERHELDPEPYCLAGERFVVSLIVSYDDADAHDPQEACANALDLTRDLGSDGTVWRVFDRQTRQMHRIEQADFDPEWHDWRR